MSQAELTSISGVGEATAADLWRAGFHSISDLANAAIEDISAVPGFGYVRAQRIRAEAKAMSDADDASAGSGVVISGAAYSAKKEKESKGKKDSKPRDKKKSAKDDSKDCGKGDKKKDKKKDDKKGKKKDDKKDKKDKKKDKKKDGKKDKKKDSKKGKKK